MTTHIIEPLHDNEPAPLGITALNQPARLEEFVARNLQWLTTKLAEHGAILFRGYEVNDVAAFARFIAATGSRGTPHGFGSTRGLPMMKQIHTPTEDSPHLETPLHNEYADLNTWPRWLAFCCVMPAAAGGEVLIADLHAVSRSLGPALLDRFERAQVQYVRHFQEGGDLSWTSQGVIRSPLTGERLFFNQAHLFYGNGMKVEGATAMHGALDARYLPRHARYGDGTEIPSEVVLRIHQAFQQHAVIFPWQRGDVLWIDNMQAAHGRRPFQGERRLLTALLDPSDD